MSVVIDTQPLVFVKALRRTLQGWCLCGHVPVDTTVIMAEMAVV